MCEVKHNGDMGIVDLEIFIGKVICGLRKP